MPLARILTFTRNKGGCELHVACQVGQASSLRNQPIYSVLKNKRHPGFSLSAKLKRFGLLKKADKILSRATSMSHFYHLVEFTFAAVIYFLGKGPLDLTCT
jgi:hypothetical protein